MNKKSILVVDDEEGLRQTLSFNLKKQGYRVETADSGEEAIQKFLLLDPDLVITDLMMEGMTGLDVLKEVKRKNSETMVIVLTGYGSMDTAIEALRLGAFDYLQKPCDRGELALKITSGLDKQELIRQNRVLTEELILSNSRLMQEEKKLEAKSKNLERSNKDLNDFAAIVSHDLNEPLRKIIAFGDQLHEKCDALLDEQSKDYLDRMRNAAQRMQNLIDNMLKLSQVTLKGKPFETVNLNQVLEEVEEDLETRIAHTQGTINLGNLPRFEGDVLQIRQLFQNLISNALKFHKEDEPPVINIDGSIDSQGICQIKMEDNGIGFEDKDAERIFQPFERLHGRSAFEGTGIGLAICKKIVERHEGKISASSIPGKGTKFIIEFPSVHNTSV